VLEGRASRIPSPLESHGFEEERSLRPSIQRLREWLAGLVVIVVGVLLALAGDAAWAARADRIREQQVLKDLLEEFRENEAILLEDIEDNRKAKAAAALWADAMLGELVLPADSVNALLLAAQEDARFDPVTGALRSLIDGGELRLIQSSELRQALAGWTDRTEEARLTTNSWDGQKQSLVPLVLSFPPGALQAPSQRTAILMTERAAAGQDTQVAALLPRVREIISLIEDEIRR
jgi:hypothetical protein